MSDKRMSIQRAGCSLVLALWLGVCMSALAEGLPGLKTRYGEGSKMLDEFSVLEPADYKTDAKINFVIRGEPGGKAQVMFKLANGSRTVALKETDMGVYEGAYVIRRSDRFDKRSFAASLSKRGVVSEAWAQAPGAAPAAKTSTAVKAPSCAGCGRVVAVKEAWEESGETSVPGMVAGGVVGGLLGSQVGSGSGKDLATIAGAGAGAYAGNEVAKRLKYKVWHVDVKLDNGTMRTWKFKEMPNFTVGQRVRAGAEGRLEALE